MIMLAIAVVWAGYAACLWGYCLLRGYCVTPADIVNWKYPASMAQPQQAAQASASPAVTPLPGGTVGAPVV